MPKKYVQYVPAGTLVPDVTAAPKMLNQIDGVSMDGGKTWSPRTDFLNRNVQAWRKPLIFRTNSSVTDDSCYIGFSTGAVYPDVVAGHTYIFSVEVKNMSSVTMLHNRVIGYAPEGSSKGAPLTENQTEYTRLWQTFTASPGYVFLEYRATVAGRELRYAIRSYAVYDVTGIDPGLYEAIGTQRFIAFRNRFSSVFMKDGEGISRVGSYVGVDTASTEETAAGAFGKAITTDKLKAWINDSESYKVKDNSGNEVHLVNLAMTYTTEAMASSYCSTNAQDATWSTMRSVWGTVNVGIYGGRYFPSTNVVRNKWIISDPSGHKYIVSYDAMNETDKSGSYATFIPSGSPSNITGVVNRTYGLRIWEHCGFLVTASGNFSIDFRICGLAVGDQFRGSFKNFCLYDVTNIPASYYPMIAAGQKPLLQGVDPVQIQSKNISYKKASVADVIGNTTNKNYIVDGGTLHDAVNLGRAVDVTSEGLYQTLAPPTGYDLRGTFILTAANTANNVETYYGFTYGPSLPFPKYAEGLKYLFIADVRNESTFVLNHIAFNNYSSSNPYRVEAINGIPMSVENVPAKVADSDAYTRIACTTTKAWNCIRANQSTGSAQTIKVGVKAWRQYEVTMLSDEAIATMAKMPIEQLDDAFYRYLIKQDAVNPWIDIIDMQDATSVTIGSGLVYRLTATSGTHTLTVDTFPEDAQGEDAYISITTSSSGVITVQAPLVLMDPIVPNAINNCRVVFRNNEARLYVENHDSGYIVVTASGTEYGTLFYGLTKQLPVGQDTEYISFSNMLDGEIIEVSGMVGTLTKPVSLLGDGSSETIITFLNGMVGTSQTLNVDSATVKDLILTSGNLILKRCTVKGTINASGSTVTLDYPIGVNGTIRGTVLVIGSTLSGTGSIDLNNTVTQLSNISVSGLSISNGYRTSSLGGALRYNTAGEYIISNCKFFNNRVIAGFGDSTGGGSLYVTGSGVSVTVEGSTFSDNVVSNCGGAIRVQSSGRLIVRNSLFVNNRCEHTNNTSDHGGGVIFTDNNDTVLEMENCIMSGNSVHARGGAVFVYNGSTASLTSCLITGNNAGTQGGGVGMRAGTLNITGTTFSNNTASSGKAIYSSSSVTIAISSCTFDTDQDIWLTGASRITISGNNRFDAKVSVGSGTITMVSGSTINLAENSLNEAIVANPIIIQGGLSTKPTMISYNPNVPGIFEDVEIRGRTIANTGLVYGATVYSHAGDDHYVYYIDDNHHEQSVIVTGETTYVVPGGLRQVAGT